MSTFERVEATYKSIVGPEMFEDPEYARLRVLAIPVFKRLEAEVGPFLSVVKGAASGASAGWPGLETALCIPMRLLGKASINAFPSVLSRTLDDLITNTFYLGLQQYLLLWTFPTRDRFEAVDARSLVLDFGVEALVADREMAEYAKAGGGLPQGVFEVHYKKTVRPTLQDRFSVGMWRIGKAHSQFRNLFFAGALLGMKHDLATKTPRAPR